MLESFKHYNIKNVGEEVTLTGWVSKVRNLGGLVFIDLRNRRELESSMCKINNVEISTWKNLKNIVL